MIENSAIGNICYVDETGYIYYIYAGKEKFIKYDSKQGKILDRNITSKDVNKMLNERTLKKHGLSSDKDQELIEIFKENNTSEELLSNEVNNKSSLYQSLRDALTLNANRDKDRVSGSTSTHNLGKTNNTGSSSRSSLRLNASSNSNTKSKGRFILGVGGGFGDSRTTTDSSNKVVATLPYYSQTDSRWSHMSYSNENDPTKRREDFGEAGCGPTALAMATNAIGSHKTPADYGKMALKYGYRDNTGTNWNFMTDAATDEGYYVNQSILPNADFIDEELSKGRPIVLSGMNTDDSQVASRSVFTKRGHYVTIVGKDAENNVLVQDPRGRAYSGAFPLRDVLSQTTAAWSFSRNKNDNTADNTRQKMLYTTSKNSIATPIRSRNLFMKAKTGGYGDQAALGMAMVQWMLCIYMRNTWVSGARNCGDGIGGY